MRWEIGVMKMDGRRTLTTLYLGKAFRRCGVREGLNMRQAVRYIVQLFYFTAEYMCRA